MMQLALKMGATLQELNERMTAKEFSLWCEFYRQQPWGAERDNYHSAMQCSLNANINAPKGKTFSINDFMYQTSDAKKKSELDSFVARFTSMSVEKK